MSQLLCPCCELFGTPPERVNFIIITGLPWNSIRYRIRRWLLGCGTDRVHINNRVDLTDYQSLAGIDDQLFEPTSSSLSKRIRSVSPAQKCCHGYSLTLLEEFDKTDPFVWDQFKQDILYQLDVKTKPEDNTPIKGVEPVSWVVIDYKRCMERENLNFFLKLKDSHGPLLSYTFTIICVIGDETQLFQNCILECVNYHEYKSSVYPDYQHRLQDFLENLNASSTLQDRTLFIEQSEVSTNKELRAFLLNLPTKVSEYSTRKESFRQHVKNMLTPCRRTVHDINVFRSNARKQCEKVASERLRSIFSELLNSTTAESAVCKITRTILIDFKCMSTEQRRIYEQKLICGLDSNDAKQSRTIAAQLTRYALQLINKPENTMSLIYDIIRVICTLGKHRHFCHELFNNTSEIFILSMSLVCQRQYALVLAGLRLCKTILDGDRVEHKYAITYLRYDKLASRKIMDAIEWLLMPYQALKIKWKKENEDNNSYDQELLSKVEENQCLQHAAILVGHKYIQCLSSLLYGSVEHCAQITIDDVNRLVETIDILVDNRLSHCIPNEKPFTLMLVSDLCAILYPVLQYGLCEVALTLRCKTSLLKAIPEAVRSLLHHGKEFVDPCIHFYTMLIGSVFKDWKVGYVTETDQFVTLPIISNVESITLANTKKVQPILTQDTTLNLSRDLISSYFELNRKYQDILLKEEKSTVDEAQKFLNMEWQKLDRLELKLENTRLKQDNDSMQQKIFGLRDELERTRSDRDQLQLQNNELARSISEFRLISLPNSKVPSQPTALADSTMQRNKDSINLELENILPQNITREQAESFIQEIYHRRETFNEHDMRKSICGSLKHLGSDLYSSSVHFLHELIQNAEDNIYASTETPRLRIVIDHDFILLSNNEQGLRACDVSAICSLAVSTKQLNEHIGEKGVGFKSVFAASNQPTLFSHAWKFAFHIPGRDEMSYITPVWMSDDDDAIPSKIRDHIAKEPRDTYIYLPLKLHPSTTEAKEFLDQVAQAADPCILINLRRLEHLEIFDERKSQSLLVTKKVTVMEQKQWQGYITFEGFTFTNLTESLVQLERGPKQNSFRVYTTNIIIPSKDEHRATTPKTTRIILAFPCDTEYKLAYNVYAGLPVCNLGFNFLFNADFQLVTNRESIRENVPFNGFIRNHLSVLFVYILLNDNNIRKNMNYYCPLDTNNQLKHSPWWLRMIDRINELITKHFSTLLNINSGKSIRRLNIDLASLVSKEQLFDCVDIQVICEEDGILTNERLKTFQVMPISIIDVLNCFPNQENQSNESRQKFWHWAQKKNVDWWTTFYQHIDQSMTDELSSLLLKKPIFLLQTDPHRQYLPAHTTISGGRYVADNLSLHMWKRQLILLQYTSHWERSALLNSKQVQLLTDEHLIQIILYDHLQISLSSITTGATEIQIEEVWQDLAYLKSKIGMVNKFDRFLVPIQGPSRLVPIQDATLPTILGANIQDFLHTSNTHVIRFPYDPNSLHDDLEWEHFFYFMNCQKPMVHIPSDRELVHLPILRSFVEFTNTKLAEEIFSMQLAGTQDCLRQLPICAHANGHDQIYPVSATFDKTITNDLPYLPQVDVPPNCRSLAKMLGVICDYDLQTCVTVLEVMSEQKITDLLLYIHWLRRLQLYIGQQRIQSLPIEVLLSCHIYLLDHQQFRSLKDLLVVQDHTEHRTSIELVSKYLNLPVISPSINKIYWEFKDLFDVLNCTCTVNLSHLFQTIHLASCDENNFYALGDGRTVLKEMAVEKMISLYQHLETLILKCVMKNKTSDALHNAIVQKRNATAPCGSREDWEWRFGLTCAKVSAELQTLIELDLGNEQLPLLTSDRELVFNTNGIITYACMEQKIIENLAKDAGKRFFISPLITNTCPLVLAALNIDYVERRGIVCWIHKNNNTEQVLEKVTDIFRETLEDPEIEVVTAKYTHVTLLLSDLSLLNPNDKDLQSNVDSYTFDSDFQFWIFGKIVLLSIGMIHDDSKKSMIATSALITLLYKRKLIPIEKAKSIAQQKMNKHISFSAKEIASVASTGPQYYFYTDIIFPIDNLSIGTSSILLGSQFDTESDSFHNQTPMITMERRVEDRLYLSRVKRQDHRTLVLENSKKPADCKIVDHNEQMRIGENAEHFFFRYLQKEYGVAYVSPTVNWCSSNRRKLFPGSLRGIDDTVGYDFFLHDKKEIFVKGFGSSTKKCYFEVKGTGGSFNVQETRFHISENERNTCESIAFNEGRKETEVYVIVIVEHCLDPEKIGLAALINWSENFKLICTSPDSYICYIVLPSPTDPKKTQEPSANNPSPKPAPYVPPHRRK